jgi:signal recognition particle GTPase
MLKKGLFKNIFQKVNQIFEGRPAESQEPSPYATAATPPPAAALSRRVDEELFEELEEALIGSDLNVHTTLRLM